MISTCFCNGAVLLLKKWHSFKRNCDVSSPKDEEKEAVLYLLWPKHIAAIFPTGFEEKGGKFPKKIWCCVGREDKKVWFYCEEIREVYSTEILSNTETIRQVNSTEIDLVFT